MEKSHASSEIVEIFLFSASLHGYTQRHTTMCKPTFLLLPFASLLLASCGDKRGTNYDTVTPSYDDPAAATYGDAAYDESSVTPTPAPGVFDAPPVAATTPAASREHYVAPGDSLWKLSKQYGVSIDAIKQANNMTNDTVILGKKMIIPAP